MGDVPGCHPAGSGRVVRVPAGHINGRETEDRTTLALPAHQERLLRAARTANPAGRRGELVFRDCDFGKGAAGITVEATGEGTIELSLGDGPVLSVLTLSPGTAGPYDYATVSAPVVVAAGVHDVRLGLARARRLLRLRSA